VGFISRKRHREGTVESDDLGYLYFGETPWVGHGLGHGSPTRTPTGVDPGDAGRNPRTALVYAERVDAHLSIGDVPAAKQLGPLLESLGDTTAALEQYRMIVDAWGEGDPELRPAARRAQERIDALGG
jgi:hypothetical protein